MMETPLYQEAARPVVFEADCEGYSYWGLGSSVLVWHADTYFWVTAKHVMEKQSQSFETLRIFPADASRMSLPFNALCKINTPDPEEEFADLYILQINLAEFASSGDAPLTAQDLAEGTYCTDNLSAGDDLLIVGYPEESRSVDYEQFKIKYKRHILPAVFVGPGSQRHCYQLRIKDNLGLSTYNGLSGSPIFRIVTVGSFAYPMFVGLLLRGSAESQIGHFVGSQVISHATKEAGASSADAQQGAPGDVFASASRRQIRT